MTKTLPFLAARQVSESDGLTIGKLITFQLYWNMISNSYRQLNSVLVQFTVARGAAQRVFEMMVRHNSCLFCSVLHDCGGA